MSIPNSVWLLRESSGEWRFSFDPPTASGQRHYARKGRLCVEMAQAERVRSLEAEVARLKATRGDCEKCTLPRREIERAACCVENEKKAARLQRIEDAARSLLNSGGLCLESEDARSSYYALEAELSPADPSAKEATP